MNIPELKAAMARKGYSIPKLAEAVGVSKKTMYMKFEGTSCFTQKEIASIADVLDLCNDEIIHIFFDIEVA